jgi:DNA-binding response OmpR family regulator
VALRQALELPLTAEKPVETLPATSQQQSATEKQKPRLLVVDDDAALAQALVSEASSCGLQAEIATDLSKAREAIASINPDVILLDLSFPDSAESGIDLLAELTTKQPQVPVLVFTAQESFAQRVQVARLGARGFLQKPVSPARVMEAVTQVLQQAKTPGAKLLLVDDDPQLLDFLRTLLEPWGFNLTLLNDPQQFWNTLEQTNPDLLIVDVEMPHLSGIDLCQVVRNDPRWSDLPVLFLSARTDAQTVQRVFAVGADDYVNKPVVGPELVARVLNRLERVQMLRKLRKLMR